MKTTDTFPSGTTRIVAMDTKKHKDAIAVHHVVTFDFSDATIEQVMGFAVDALKVKIQGPIRKSPQKYPKGALKVKVSTVGNGTRSAGITPEMLRATLTNMTQAERDAL